MKHLKKILLMLLLPLSLQAVGFGVYVPFNFEEKSSVNYESTYYEKGYSQNRSYKPSAGFGLVFDTNIQKDKLFNYRLGLETLNRMVKDINNTSCTNNCNQSTRVNIVNTFGFGIVRSQNIRVWIGPRINVAYHIERGNNEYHRSELEFGVAPAMGINIDLDKTVSLGLDLDYRAAAITGSSGDSNYYSSINYNGSTQGATARFYLIFKLRDGFTPPPKKIAPSIEDDSL